jgi:hypothetical protein
LKKNFKYFSFKSTRDVEEIPAEKKDRELNMAYLVSKQLRIAKVVNINRFEDNIHGLSTQHLDGDYWKIDSSDPRTQRKLNREKRKLQKLGYSTILHSVDPNNNNSEVPVIVIDNDEEEEEFETDYMSEVSETTDSRDDILCSEAYELTEWDIIEESQTNEDIVEAHSLVLTPSNIVDQFSDEEIKLWNSDKLRAWSLRHIDPNAYYYRFKGNLLCVNDNIHYFVDIGVLQHKGRWSKFEHNKFIGRCKEFKLNKWPLRRNWGIFSLGIPNRVGSQCADYYRALLERGILSDPDYIWKNGRLHYKNSNVNNSNVRGPSSLNNSWNDTTTVNREILIEGKAKSLHIEYDPISTKQQSKLRQYFMNEQNAHTRPPSVHKKYNFSSSAASRSVTSAESIGQPRSKSVRKPLKPQKGTRYQTPIVNNASILSRTYITYSIPDEPLPTKSLANTPSSNYPLLAAFLSKSHLFIPSTSPSLQCDSESSTLKSVDFIINWKIDLENIEFYMFYIEHSSSRIQDIKSHFYNYFQSLLHHLNNLEENLLQELLSQMLYTGAKGN